MNTSTRLGCILLTAALWLAMLGALHAQNAAPKDRNAVNNTHAASDMMADSPVKFPKDAPLPAKYPEDLRMHYYRAEKDYYLFDSPSRSLKQIAKIQAEMPKGQFTAPANDWKHLARTRRRLTEGGDLRILALGDSIVCDTMRSGWVAKLQEAYPKAKIKATVYVRGGGGCKHYRLENRVQNYLLPWKPDLVLIGGISQGKDYDAIRDVIRQVRAARPDCEFLLASGVFGSVDPRSDAAMAQAEHSGTSDYGAGLQKLAAELDCQYLDMTRPWMQYIRSSKLHPHLFYRDSVHANEYGEQILSKILMAFFQPAS